MRPLSLHLALLVAACTSTPATPDRGDANPRVDKRPDSTSSPDRLIDRAHDGLLGDSALPDSAVPDSTAGPPPSQLPFPYSRPDVGQPVTAAELQAITDKYLELLKDTRYFDFLEERVHGWPQTDPAGKYWYGTWWSGVTVIKKGGQVTYLHNSDGADNNGLRTAQLMEGTCYALLLWNRSKDELLLHRMVRGFSSWIMALKKQQIDPTQILLSRAAYPVAVKSAEGGRDLYIDYSLNRPGLDNGATEYVHLPQNPHWGDIWVKNKRSKDDLGHMFRGMGQIEACAPRLSPQGVQSLDKMRLLYRAWSQQVEDDGWAIATLDKNLNLWVPPDTLAHFTNLAGAECAGMLALRLMGRGDPGQLDCGNGISLAEILGGELIKSGNKQMFRTYHEAAANHALLAKQSTVALKLLQGLAVRIEQDLPAVEAGTPPSNLNPTDFASLVMHAANVGVPLTSREVRWLHTRIEQAHASFRSPGLAPHFRVFDPATPDGTYAYEPGGAGIWVNDLGLALGSCASQYRNPTGRPILDCARVLQGGPP
jgi:hypothetical protein